jgi:hypothetical protein
MCNYSAKVNTLKIRFSVSNKPYFISSNLSKNGKHQKGNLFHKKIPALYFRDFKLKSMEKNRRVSPHNILRRQTSKRV